MASACLRGPNIPSPAKPMPLPIPASMFPPLRRSSGLRSRTFCGVTTFTQGESTSNCFASSAFHCETGLSFQDASAAINRTAARGTEHNLSVGHIEWWTSLDHTLILDEKLLRNALTTYCQVSG